MWTKTNLDIFMCKSSSIPARGMHLMLRHECFKNRQQGSMGGKGGGMDERNNVLLLQLDVICVCTCITPP